MYCEKCGKEISDKAVVCTGCGCMLKTAPPIQQSKQKKKQSPWWILLSALVGGVTGYIVVSLIIQ